MSDPVQLALIALAATIVPSILTFINGLRQQQNHQAVEAKLIAVSNKVDTVHDDVNGKMEKLIKVSGEAEKAKGNLEGRAEAKAEQDSKD